MLITVKLEEWEIIDPWFMLKRMPRVEILKLMVAASVQKCLEHLLVLVHEHLLHCQ